MHTAPYRPPDFADASVALAGRSFAPRVTPGSQASAYMLTGGTLAPNVVTSSLTSVGTLAALTVTAPITGSVTGASGSTTGNAATATALATARAINGVNFDGTAPITVTAAAGTLTGATLAAGVTASSLTSIGTLSTLVVSNAAAATAVGSVSAIAGQNAFVSIAGNGNTPLSSSFDLLQGSDSTAYVYQRANMPLKFATNSTIQAILDAAGQFALQTAGKGISIKEGSNCKQGKATMVAGAVTVSTTAVTSSSRVFVSINDAGSGALANIGALYVNNIVATTSFDIRSTNILDTSSVVWLIMEPS